MQLYCDRQDVVAKVRLLSPRIDSCELEVLIAKGIT
jgi:hypothetical protein